MGRTNIDARRESLAVSIRKCQDENTIPMYGLSKWFTIILPQFCFQHSKILFCNITNFLLILWWLTGYDWLDMRELVNQLDRRDVLWRENVKQMKRWTAYHETRPIEATTIQGLSKSKWLHFASLAPRRFLAQLKCHQLIQCHTCRSVTP